MRAWQVRGPGALERLQAALDAEFPGLTTAVEGGLVHVTGPFVLADASGAEVDQYEIDVCLPANFPIGVPQVKETAGRIPRAAAHHCYTDGTLCLFAPGERWRYWPEGQGLMEFLRGPVKSYFVGHSIYELKGEWRFGERSHGARGIVEAYADLVGSTEPRTLVRYLSTLARKKLVPHRACPCGSGRRTSICHRSLVQSLRQTIHWRDAKEALVTLAREHRALFRRSRHLRLRRGVERGG
jgi:hypothetical protein